MNSDLINALFEMLGAGLQWMNVVRLMRDRRVAGVMWHVTAFFALWGAWNIYFYSAVQSPLSAWAASFMTLANCTWVYLALKYRRNV